ncbi:MAG: MFS transporter [Bdellovibrionota bacterium]
MDTATYQHKLKSNLPKLYAFSFFQCFLVLIPVVVPYLQGKGLTLEDVFLLQAIFGATLIVSDAPAGYLADLFGRKRSLIIGSVVLALGYQVLWFGETFVHFAIWEVILGFGLSLQSGCDVAILYNTLDELGTNGRKAGFLGRRITAQTTGEGFASILASVLTVVSLALPAYVNALTSWIPVFIAMTLVEPAGQRMSRTSHLENFRAIARALFGHSKMLTFAILNFIFYGFATYCAVWMLQPYWKSLGIPVAVFGFLWAANSFAAALVSRFAHAIEEKIGSTTSIVVIALLPIVGYLGMGHAPGHWGLAFILAFPLCRGLNQVLFLDAINTRVPPEMRATTNSIGSLGMRALFIVFGPLVGRTLDTQGPQAALSSLGIVYVIGFCLIALPLLSQRRHFRME